MSEDKNQETKEKEITMNEFLEFLKISCQVTESNENRFIQSGNRPAEIDYDQLARNELVNRIRDKKRKMQLQSNETASGSDAAEKSPNKSPTITLKSTPTRRVSVCSHSNARASSIPTVLIDPSLSDKLDEVINEGILDSVLPFLCTSYQIPNITNPAINTNQIKPKPTLVLQNTVNIGENLPSLVLPHQDAATGVKIKKNTSKQNTLASSSTLQPNTIRASRRRSSANPLNENTEVVIHVCDEVKNVSRDFLCPQKLLVTKMGYFADVTAGQRLEDMDISVHCDLQIFEWLMKWVKRETLSVELWPILDASNVVPILVSASFLQMEPLLVDCLSFCHSNLSEVVRVSPNLSCLNDTIISRLASMFTNLELEHIKDKRERVTPRLWTKLIQSLCESEPQSLRGHFSSLADLFKCNRCSKLLTQTISTYVHCVPQNMKLNRWGQLISLHSKDSNWNITSFVAGLHKDLKSWRKVYWRLWGSCHFLLCSSCETYFPAYQMLWCRYHPEQPQFLGPLTEGRMPGPAGRYPCCGQMTFRYEALSGPTGCHYREHTVQLESEKDRAILNLIQIASEGGCIFEPPPLRMPAADSEMWWNGVALMPSRCRQGLLPTLHVDEFRPLGLRKLNRRHSSAEAESSSDSDSTDESAKPPVNNAYSSSSDGCESDGKRPVRRKCHRQRGVKPNNGRYWSGDISARSNQDNQREYEERAMKLIVAMVEKKTGWDQNVTYQSFHQGGTYTRLEAEWRDNLKHKGGNSSKNKSNK